MPRPEKVQAVEEIRDRFQGSSATFLTEYRGLSVVQLEDLRTKLREVGGSYKVYKMTLARLAADEVGAADLREWMGGPTALAFAGDDPVLVAKALSDYAKDHEPLVIKGGLLSGEILVPEMVAKLATIEPREVLLAKIVGAAKAPLVNLAGLMAAFTRNAASMFSQLLEQKESDAPEPEPSTAQIPADEAPAEQPVEGAESADEAIDEEAGPPADDTAVEDAPTEDPPADATEPAAAPRDDDPANATSGGEGDDDPGDGDEPEAASSEEEQDSTDEGAGDGDAAGEEE